MASSVLLRGTALHRGGPAEVRLTRTEGPITFACAGTDHRPARLDELRPVRTDRGVTVATADGRVRIDLVEHLLAAAGGLGVSGGLLVEVAGGEIPLLDGGALRFAEALASLDLPRGRSLRVAREAVIACGRATYRFRPGPSPALQVRVDFPPPVGRWRVSWDGDAGDFVARIAPARTFGWVHELEALRAAGRAAAVDLASVIVLDDRGPIAGCRADEPDEPARHKLLDLTGDLALYGGPPLGLVEAVAPGHTATHAVVAHAIAAGVLV